jgi:hypothetical protein
LERRGARWNLTNSNRTLPTFAGRNMGTVILVFVQSLIGVIHVFFGLWLLSVPILDSINSILPPLVLNEYAYSVYTTVFGVLTLLFIIGIWLEKKWGWFGTVFTSFFVTLVDSLTLLNLPSIPGIPKFAAFAEIVYSVILLLYLFQPHVRRVHAKR